MKKSEIIECLKVGGSLTVDAELFFFGELRNCAEAARTGGGIVTIIKSDWLGFKRIRTICKDGRGHVAFPDVSTKS